jgi:shikimate kinase
MLPGKNIVLIGMPACGKSTIGVLLAKHLSRWFIDTDLCIQSMEGRSLQEIIDTDGLEYFRQIEQKHVLSISASNAVIATGGSVIYSGPAMEKFSKDSVTVLLDLPLDDIKRRLTNLYSRGVVMAKGQSLEELYRQRRPLYEKYAQITVDCTGRDHQQTLAAIIEELESQG